MKKTKKSKKLEELGFFPTGNNWKNVLLEIYNNSPHSYGESHKISFNDNNHPLAKKLKITGYELMLSISFLRNHKLISDNNKFEMLKHEGIDPSWNNQVSLTKEGFEIAIKLENEINNQKTQNVVMIFTAIIGYTGVMVFLKGFIEFSNSLFFWSYVVITLLLLVSFHLNNLFNKFRRFRFNRYVKNGGSVAI